MTNVPAIHIEDIAKQLDYSLKVRDDRGRFRPVMFWSAPGVGKSSAILADAKRQAQSRDMDFNEVQPGVTPKNPENTFAFIDLRLSSLDMLDLKGALFVNEKDRLTEYLKSGMLPDARRNGRNGYLFLDEIPEAAPSTLVSASSLIWDGKIADNYRLPEGWLIIGAGNTQGVGASAKRLPSQINNRFRHLEVLACAKRWADYIRAKNGSTVLAAFIQGRPELLSTWQDKNSIAFATGRSLEGASEAFLNITDDDVFREQVVASYIGTGPAVELEGFAKLFASGQIPVWSQIRDNPNEALVPTAGSHAASIMYMAISLISKNVTTVAEMPNIVAYLERLPGDLANVAMLDIRAKDESLLACKAVTEWRAKNPTAI